MLMMTVMKMMMMMTMTMIIFNNEVDNVDNYGGNGKNSGILKKTIKKQWLCW